QSLLALYRAFICGSRIHSIFALAPAHTLPGSLSSAGNLLVSFVAFVLIQLIQIYQEGRNVVKWGAFWRAGKFEMKLILQISLSLLVLYLPIHYNKVVMYF